MQVGDDERVSRFIYSRAHYSPEKRRVKADAYICFPKEICSAACSDGLEEPRVWAAELEFSSRRGDGKKVKARGDAPANAFRKEGLDIIRDDDPYLHANISGWKPDSKEAQRDQALQIAAIANLVIKPEAAV